MNYFKNMRNSFIYILIILCSNQMFSQSLWPAVGDEAKPYTRWWWLGSAVDEKNLDYLLSEYAKAGLGGLEITPIYGVQGNEQNEIDFLSPRWMEILGFINQKADAVGLKIDMNTGTGWPFGGPYVTPDEAAQKVVFKDGKFVSVPTKQKVKRAAPGGEGFVMDHYNRKAVEHYLDRFSKAFKESGVRVPHNFFNDSYEVYGANWTEKFPSEFEKRRGYSLTPYYSRLEKVFTAKEDDSNDDITRRLISDYRETLGELLYENFTKTWTDWAHKLGSKTRNQAHGSPANLIDLYAAVDIPECEGFGLSNFGIKGLRKDSLTRKNDSDLSMLKYASSGAHISGKPLVSSETFTWLTEHWRTSLAQCKPELDLFFLSGINHVVFHGTPYSPREAEWPGWCFYASINVTPNNFIWRDLPEMNTYITRCQSFMQMGKPDNDLLVYLPVYDMWYENKGSYMMFTIHGMSKLAPRFISSVNRIIDAGYDVDYISDKFIRSLSVTADKQLMTEGGTVYKALVLPGVRLIPVDILSKIVSLKKQGAHIIFLDSMPADVPGLANLDRRRKEFKKLMKQLRDVETTVEGIEKESIPAKFIRRKNDNGYHYFISALQANDVDEWVTLNVPAKEIWWYNPLDGSVTIPKTTVAENGKMKVRLQLRSGESCILRTFNNKTSDAYILQQIPNKRYDDKSISLDLMQIVESKELGDSAAYYKFAYNNVDSSRRLLEFEELYESARIIVNGSYAGTMWCLPYRLDIGDYLKPGEHIIAVDVMGLPANRIAEMDRKGIVWRKFKDTNVVDLNYKKTTYENWGKVPIGLNIDNK